MRIITYILTILIMVLACALAVQDADASDFHLLQLDELSVDYRNFAVLNDKARNLLTYPESPKEGVNLNLNSSIAKVVYWNSTIEAMTTGAQYKSIGLLMGLGVRISPYVEVGYLHHSQHVLDGRHPYMKYPVEDSLTLKLYFYRVDKPNNTLLR